MIGALVQPRSPWITSTPSRSGSPRSSMTTSGGCLAASASAIGWLLRSFQQGHRLHPECLPYPVEYGGQRLLTAQDAVGRGDEQFRFGGCPGRLLAAPGGVVDHRADHQPDCDEYPRASTLFGLRDGPFVQRRGEVEVQQQRACDGLEHRGTKPPTIATAMTAARKASTSVVRLSSCLRLARKRVSSCARTTARAWPASLRGRVSPPLARGRGRPAWPWA